MKISTKLLIGFSTLIILGIVQLVFSYKFQNGIINDARQIKYVEDPLGNLAKEIVCYDSELTGYAQSALLNAQAGNELGTESFKQKYNEKGSALALILEKDIHILLNRSKTKQSTKDEITEHVGRIKAANAILTKIESDAFTALATGDTQTPRELLTGEAYTNSKNELYQSYHDLVAIQQEINLGLVTKVDSQAQQVLYLNVIITIIFIVNVLYLLFVFRAFLNSTPTGNN